MTEELDVLRIISERLRAADVPFMLTGSFALGYYGKPRMTRDLDFVVALMERHVDALVSAFSTDFNIDEDAARSAIKSQQMFNLMHLDGAIKVVLIVRTHSRGGMGDIYWRPISPKPVSRLRYPAFRLNSPTSSAFSISSNRELPHS